VRSAVSVRLLQKQLEAKNNSLRETFKTLQETQSQLVHREKMASLGQLVAGVAHEINNPVGFIIGNLYYLEEHIASANALISMYESEMAAHPEMASRSKALRVSSRVDDWAGEWQSIVGGIREGAERAAHAQIVQDLRLFSRHDRAEVIEADLNESLESTLRLLRDRLKTVELVKEYGSLPPVRCFGGQINQVFMNVISNAIDSLGLINRRITVRTRCAESDAVEVEIEDTGSGITAEVLEKVFDPFFTTKDVGKGTGLGLSVSYGIIERHHGRIEVSSNVGSGTTFRIWLPISMEVEAVDA
jgi:two-component system, NtrC family, sensor kinase